MKITKTGSNPRLINKDSLCVGEIYTCVDLPSKTYLACILKNAQNTRHLLDLTTGELINLNNLRSDDCWQHEPQAVLAI